MNLRRRLLLMFSVVLIAAVAAVAWAVSLRTRRAFEQVDQERTDALVFRFRGEFQRRGTDVARRLEKIAATDAMQHVAFDAIHGGDTAVYVREAEVLAQQYELDFLEILDANGTIISSAQFPARFGYKEPLPSNDPAGAFLKNVEVPNGSALGLIALRKIESGEGAVYLVGGERLDSSFLQALSLAPGMHVWLYRIGDGGFNAQNLIGNTNVQPGTLAGLVEAARSGQERNAIVPISGAVNDRDTVQAIPLRDDAAAVSAVLMVGTSRQPLISLQQHIRAVAFTVAGVGILVAIIVSLWVTARFTRPIEELADASREVAAGHWDTQVEVRSRDELYQLAESFNSMTRQLTEQRERLLQTERVAAWRELARRLAHELKNPLFPLQITVENLVRAREVMPEEFDEVFKESTTTLLAEINNLKTIISRFSDFSKMPQPQLQASSINAIVDKVAALHQAQLQQAPKPILMKLDLDASTPHASVDPELFHRVISNLVLNAVDAMPEGGAITIRTRDLGESVRLEVSDTGTGLAPEERDRLFTPYYTTKRHGTGLGLAVVQSVVSDHHGSISVASERGQGATFIITIPKRSVQADSLNTGATA